MTDIQTTIYETLHQLGIEYLHVEVEDGTTMESCIPVGEALGHPVIKTLFLTNRQQNRFWLYVTAPDVPFVTKDFCARLEIPRVSFASEELLIAKLGTPHGASTVLALVHDKERDIQLVMDQPIVDDPYISCTDGSNTGFVRIAMADLLQKYLPHTGHQPQLI